MSVWVRHKILVNSGQTRNNASRVLRQLFKPDRQMCLVASECLKSDNTYVVDYQYFAKLDNYPEPDVMITAFKAFEKNEVPMSRAEFERRRYDYYHANRSDILTANLIDD